jgi:hypothetical protein
MVNCSSRRSEYSRESSLPSIALAISSISRCLFGPCNSDFRAVFVGAVAIAADAIGVRVI